MPDHDSGLAAYQAIDAGAAVRLTRDVLRAAGPDVAAYLQGQLSQDVLALVPGGSAWTWLLQPAGKVDALVRVSRLEPDEFVLDVDAGYGAAVVARLNRFKLRVRGDIEPLAWQVVALRGAAVAGMVSSGALVPDPGHPLVVDPIGGRARGVDLVGPDPHVPEELTEVGIDVWEVARIEAGEPAMGTELTERTIPAETGLVTETVSFTKGCYTGQELVARIDSRGSRVARNLRGLAFGRPASAGAQLSAGDKAVGTVTSVAESPTRGWVGLGYVARAVEVGDTVDVDGGGTAQVVALPFER